MGAGPAGSATAIHLAGVGLRVTLYDPRPVGASVGECLPSSTLPLLLELGLSRPLPPVAEPAAGTLSAWGREGLSVVDHLHLPHGSGWTLDRPAFDRLLRERAVAEGAQIQTEGAPPEAPWRIDATGRRAVVARAQGARRLHEDRLFAFYQHFRAELPGDTDPRLLLEAADDGWWYTVRAPDGRRVVAWLTDRDLSDAPAGSRARDAWFRGRLIKTTWISTILARWRWLPAGPLRGADARTGGLDRVAGPGWLAVGDAAFAVDPLSSQGIADALLTARSAAAVVQGQATGEAYQERVQAMRAGHGRRLREAYALERRFQHAFWLRRRPVREERAASDERSGADAVEVAKR